MAVVTTSYREQLLTYFGNNSMAPLFILGDAAAGADPSGLRICGQHEEEPRQPAKE